MQWLFSSVSHSWPAVMWVWCADLRHLKLFVTMETRLFRLADSPDTSLVRLACKTPATTKPSNRNGRTDSFPTVSNVSLWYPDSPQFSYSEVFAAACCSVKPFRFASILEMLSANCSWKVSLVASFLVSTAFLRSSLACRPATSEVEELAVCKSWCWKDSANHVKQGLQLLRMHGWLKKKSFGHHPSLYDRSLNKPLRPVKTA